MCLLRSLRCRLGLVVVAALIAAALLPVVGVVTLRVLVARADAPLPAIVTAVLVLDRNGRLLRPFPVAGGIWRLAVEPAEVDPQFIAMLLAYEDRRFREHRGVDMRAIARAVWQALSYG